MKIGSVQFFKVLIVSVAALLVLVPLVLAIVFGVLYGSQRGRVREMEAALAGLGQPMLTAPPLLEGKAAPAPMAGGDAGPRVSASFDYQRLYPHLYAAPPARRTADPGVCYLTFDDGPSPVTGEILDVLKEAGVKATFFVTGEASEENEEVLRRAAEEGHTIGVHSYSHDYATIYASVEAFLEDFDQMYRKVLAVTGIAPEVFRFAGGSVNIFNKDSYHAITAEMLRRGFTFYDWNAAASDAVSGGLSRQQVTSNVVNSVGEQERVVVLMHDRPDTATAATALPDIIRALKAKGYRFEPLTSKVEPITYYYSDGL